MVGQGRLRRQRAPGLKFNGLPALRAVPALFRQLAQGNPLGVPLAFKATTLAVD